MKRNQLLKHCRYYKGELEYMGSVNEYHFWQAEKNYIDEYGTNDQKQLIQEFATKLAQIEIDIPLALLAELYDMYLHLTSKGFLMPMERFTMERFKTRFLDRYLARPLK
jgi:hypothetical protein